MASLKVKNGNRISRRRRCVKTSCLLIVITSASDTDMRKDAHDIIIKAQQSRGYNIHSIKFEPAEIKIALKRKTLHQQIIKNLRIDKNLNSYFKKLIILGHCWYYTINHDDSYYNQPFESHEATKIKQRSICGLNIIQMSRLINYCIKQLGIYHISLCCCESATKIVHLEDELLDELTEDEEYIYEAVAQYRLSENISKKPRFVNKSDEQDKHLFSAFKYSSKYGKLVQNLLTNKKLESIKDESLSVLDLISNELSEQKMLDSLKETLIINALNGFGYYRHPEMTEENTIKLENELMKMRMQKNAGTDDYKSEYDETLSVKQLDKEFKSGPLRRDTIYYSIKDRDGVQWLIDKDHNNLHGKRSWCSFELTKILEVDCIEDLGEHQDKVKDNVKENKYKEEYFVQRTHVIQYQFH